MNHAPASVAAAIAVTASAAVSAGLAAPRVCEGFAMVPDVKVISSGESVLASLRAPPCRGGRDHRGVFCRFDDRWKRLAPERYIRRGRHGRSRAKPFQPSASDLFEHPTSCGLTRPPRPLYSAGFATSRALRPSAISPCGGIGRRARLKIEFRKECWFDSGQGHQDENTSNNNSLDP